jgi:hypothetical protein
MNERRAVRPSAIVTHKNGDLEPGSGLYQEARALGYLSYRRSREFRSGG